jgi:O-antigen/teichoic acid export membrane protein
VYGFGAIVGRLLSYLLQPYYAHKFNPGENGVQSVVYSYIPILSIVLYLGMDVAYMRNAALRESPEQDRQRAFSMSMTVVLAIGGVLAAFALVSASSLAPVVRLDVGSFRYMVGIAFTDALLAVPYAHLRITGERWRYATFRLVFVATSIVLNVFLITYLHWGVASIFIANLSGNLLLLTLFAGDIYKLLRPGMVLHASWRPLWAYALPLIPATLAVMLVENGDRIVLNYLPDSVAWVVYHMPSKDVVGIYSFNYKLGVAMLLVVQMFRLAWVPFSLQHARQPGSGALYARVLTALMILCAPIFLAISLLLPVAAQVRAIHDYVKAGYWLGLPIVPVILLGYVFSGVYAVVTAGLYIERRTHVLAWIATAGAVLNLGICVIAAPRWGMVSVAWATPAAYAVMAGLGVWQANLVFPVPFEWRRLAHLAVSVAAIVAADQWIARLGVPPLSLAGVTSKVVLLALFPMALFATGFFRHGELRALRAVVRQIRTSLSGD